MYAHPTLPQMHQNFLEQVFIGTMACVLAFVAWCNTFSMGFAVVLGQVPSVPTAEATEQLVQSVDLLLDRYLLTVCALGSFAGATMSYLLFYKPGAPHLATVAKLATSWLSGIAFSPVLATWTANHMGFPLNGQWVLFVSGAWALMSWTVLQLIMAWHTKIIAWWGRRTLGFNPDQYDMSHDRPRSPKNQEDQVRRAPTKPQRFRLPEDEASQEDQG